MSPQAFKAEIEEIIAHLGAALMQSVPTDDQMIMDHVKLAHELAKSVRRQSALVQVGDHAPEPVNENISEHEYDRSQEALAHILGGAR